MSTQPRRRKPTPCLLCEQWATRHPSGLCRDCRPVVGPAVVDFSTRIERPDSSPTNHQMEGPK